jgi:NAD(P)-dependent dehydrogenase (short-subunit alcohol dehydrogenase family)
MVDKKIAIVTGGGSGIGRNVALTLAGGGWTVVVAGRRLDALEQTAAGHDGIHAIAADVTDAASVDQLFDQTVARFGRLDLLFNNAGVNVPAVPLDELKVEDLKSIIDVNLFGVMLCARAAMRVMKAQSPQGGRIINNGSISAYAPRPNAAPYAATKHAITGLTKSITLDGRGANIAGGQIDIGNAVTDMSARMASGTMQANGSVMSEPRMDVGHVGKTILYMANLPLEANIPFVTVMASAMPLYGRG